MKENKEQGGIVKKKRYADAKPGKFIFMTFLFWILAIGAAWLGSMIQYDTIRQDGKGDGGSTFLPTYHYSYELTAYIIGAVVFLVLFFLFWHLIMRGMFRPLRKQPKWCQFFCLLISIAGILGIFAVTIWVAFYNLGMTGKMREELLEAFTIFGWSVVALFRAIFGIRKDAKAE